MLMNHRTPWLALGLLLTMLSVARVSVMQPIVMQVEAPLISEAAWSAAIAKVTAGTSDTIQIEKFVVTDEHLAQLVNVPVKQLHLNRGRITDGGIQYLAPLRSLTAIRLRESRLTDSGMRLLAECAGLDDINLPQSQFTDVGLHELARLPKLRYLRFSSPQVTEAGLCDLAQIKSLRWLHLIRVPVTPQVLTQLATLPKLESLYVDDSPVDGTPANNAAWEAFFAARPEVHVHVNQTHHDRDPARHAH